VAGIYLTVSGDNDIWGNIANYNSCGVYLFLDCANNTISGNTLIGNSVCIYEDETSSSNIFENNDCGEDDGIFFVLFILISSISGGAVIVIATILLIGRKRKRK